MFITFEGPEGSGKSTQIRMLCEKLEKLGKDYITTYEPGGTALGRNIRKLLLDSDCMAETTELLLYAADRAEHVKSKIKPAIKDNKIVISDRYYHSTLAYQGYGRGIELDLIKKIMNIAVDGMEPDLVILIDLDVEVGFSRIKDSGREKDRIEKEALEFHKKVRNGYLNLAEENKNFIVIDGTGTPEEIHSSIWQRIERCL